MHNTHDHHSTSGRAFDTKAELLGRRYRIPPDPRFAAAGARGGDSYDVMVALVLPPAWTAVSCWGADGWDLGDWPCVVIYTRRRAFRYELAYHVEGDVEAYSYATQGELYAAIDHLALFHWQAAGEPWARGVESSDHMPGHLCGPFS